ncbi:MAG: recombinase family protein [Clostridiales bacterium]|nr:recombinase family protein [Clostridiales bacterium]
MLNNQFEITSKKRVQTLYRVSTKKQVISDDLPLQKNACRNFIENKGWKLIKEYTELGISGYKISAASRDQLQLLIQDAENGLFDILLVFMFDRLGRKGDESPQILQRFIDLGIEVWSVNEGQQRIDQHVDKLNNYIRFWQAEGESLKTSQRVMESHVQMVKQGIYRGGSAPYGYELIASDVYNRKNINLRKMIQNPAEAQVVKDIYRLAYEEGYGGARISTWLNEHNIPSRKGNGWRAAIVNKILRNPIYKGYLTFNKTSATNDKHLMNPTDQWVLSEHQNPEWTIIDEDLWNELQEMRRAKNPKLNKMLSENIDIEVKYAFDKGITKSPLLFVSMIKCGHCGHPLTTTYQQKKYIAKSGKITLTKKALYRCSGKTQSVAKCYGQTIYNKKRLESAILREVFEYIRQLKHINLDQEIINLNGEHFDRDLNALNENQELLLKSNIELDTLTSEITKSLTGNSPFEPEVLADLISKKKGEVSRYKIEVDRLKKILDEKEIETSDLIELQSSIPAWREVYEAATIDKQKMMLSKIIDIIRVFKGHVEIDINFSIHEFIKSSSKLGSCNRLQWESTRLAVWVSRVRVPLSPPIKKTPCND